MLLRYRNNGIRMPLSSKRKLCGLFIFDFGAFFSVNKSSGSNSVRRIVVMNFFSLTLRPTNRAEHGLYFDQGQEEKNSKFGFLSSSSSFLDNKSGVFFLVTFQRLFFNSKSSTLVAQIITSAVPRKRLAKK
jgi:hypothetical protein